MVPSVSCHPGAAKLEARLEIVILECNETRGASYNYYDKRCADKLKKTLAFMGKLLRYFAKLLFF